MTTINMCQLENGPARRESAALTRQQPYVSNEQ